MIRSLKQLDFYTRQSPILLSYNHLHIHIHNNNGNNNNNNDNNDNNNNTNNDGGIFFFLFVSYYTNYYLQLHDNAPVPAPAQHNGWQRRGRTGVRDVSRTPWYVFVFCLPFFYLTTNLQAFFSNYNNDREGKKKHRERKGGEEMERGPNQVVWTLGMFFSSFFICC